MGAQLGKLANVAISEKKHQEEKLINNSSGNHVDGTTTLERTSKKKKEKTSTKKSTKPKVDKYTDTTEGVRSSLPNIKQLMGVSQSNEILNHIYKIETSSTYRSETPSKDILEFREACIRRGIISRETNTCTLPVFTEQDCQPNPSDDSTNQVSTETVTNTEEVQNE